MIYICFAIVGTILMGSSFFFKRFAVKDKLKTIGLGILGLDIIATIVAGVIFGGALPDKYRERIEVETIKLLPIDDSDTYLQYISLTEATSDTKLLMKYQKNGTLYYKTFSLSPNVLLFAADTNIPKIVRYEYKYPAPLKYFLFNLRDDDIYIYINTDQIAYNNSVLETE